MPTVSITSRPRLLVVHSVYRLYPGKRVCAQCQQTMQNVYKLCTVSTDYTQVNVYVHSVYCLGDRLHNVEGWGCAKNGEYDDNELHALFAVGIIPNACRTRAAGTAGAAGEEPSIYVYAYTRVYVHIWKGDA